MRQLTTLEVVNVSGGNADLVVASLILGGVFTAGLIASNPHPFGFSGYGYDVVVYDPYYPVYDPFYPVVYDPYYPAGPYYEEIYYVY